MKIIKLFGVIIELIYYIIRAIIGVLWNGTLLIIAVIIEFFKAVWRNNKNGKQR